jgi:hypothetical protein
MTFVLPKKNLRRCQKSALPDAHAAVYIPAVGELGADLLQVRVAHVLNGEDKDVLEVVGGFLDIGEKLLGELLALLVCLGEVDDLGTLGLGHFGGVGAGLGWEDALRKKVRVRKVAGQKMRGGEKGEHRHRRRLGFWAWRPRLV